MNKAKKSKLLIRVLVSIVVVLAMIPAVASNAAFFNMLFPFATSEDGSTTLCLYRNKPTDNMPFNAENMFPGDVITQDYCIVVACENDVTLKFSVKIHEEYEKLAEVMKCRIVLVTTGETLYDGLMKDVPESMDYFISAENTGIELNYEITAYLETSVGNDYQNKKLMADFIWSADGELADDDIIEDDPIPLPDNPDTGDSLVVFVWLILLIASVAALITVIVKRRKDEADEE